MKAQVAVAVVSESSALWTIENSQGMPFSSEIYYRLESLVVVSRPETWLI